MPQKTESNGMLHGTLDALILKTLSWGVRHGYGIAKWIEEATDEAVVVEEGSLYPALYRLERRGLIEQPVISGRALRRGRAAADIRPRQPSWRDGAVVDARPGGPNLPVCRGLRHRDGRDRQTRRP